MDQSKETMSYRRLWHGGTFLTLRNSSGFQEMRAIPISSRGDVQVARLQALGLEDLEDPEDHKEPGQGNSFG